jgi:hypothetical protein
MADLRARFIEDYAGGLLNISRQELSTTGEVLSQDGLTSEGTIFVEDGSGVKSGLKLGVSLAEAVDPTTEAGVVNVRYADRTYAKIRDLKIFTTAIASAQSALSEATSTALSNLENAFELLEDDISSLEQTLLNNVNQDQEKIQELVVVQNESTLRLNELTEGFNSLAVDVNVLKGSDSDDLIVRGDLTVKKDALFDNIEVSGLAIFEEIQEKVYSMSGSQIDPSKGSIQIKTISTGTTTFTSSFKDGQTVVLMIEGGTSGTIVWPTMRWVGPNGNTPPTLTSKDTVVMWRAGGLYGAYVGSYA